MIDEIKALLRSVKEYVGEGGELLKAKVEEDVINGNKNIIKLFLNNEKAKKAFFENIEDSLIFKWKACLDFLNMNEFLPDSYTKYKNKIGLINRRGEYLSNTKDVVLSFPYKDCFLQGGQRKDDERRDEIFYNEVIAKDEIGKMVEPKIFCNVKRYTKEGVFSDVKYKEDDNLIIKGNNLIALYSILKRFEKKIKCIYIDPPYNTGSDSFNYNDSFNHSTWLTFMKNRLEAAKRLLRDDGVIFVQCDDNEQAYLKVLMDELMERKNFISNIIWQKKFSPQNNTKWLSDNHDFILLYAKNKDIWRANLLPRNDAMDARYKNPDNDERGVWTSGDISVKGINEKTIYPIVTPTKKEIFPPSGRSWIFSKEKMQEMIADKRIWFGEDGNNVPRYKRFLSEVKDGIVPLTIWLRENVGDNQEAKKEIKSIDNKDIFETPKPERLIERILTISTNPGDIVLDFFMGSATTCAVAHKMGRQYIGIEQMDYIKTISTQRLIKVLEGEGGGISKAVNWGGGGAFIYCELKENAHALIEKVQSASEENIQEVKRLIFSNECITPYITKEDLKNVEGDFDVLTLKKKQDILLKLINKNMLYLNYSDIDDESISLSECDREFNISFYDGEDD